MIYITIFGILGLLIGSFLNVIILRVPKGISIVKPRSFCPKCKKKLKYYHNIPVVSWILLRGKCYYCKKSISPQYILIELITSFIFIVSFLKTLDITYAFLIGIFFSLLLALSAIDFKYKEVPDSITLLTLLVSLIASGDILNSIKNALLFAGGFSLLRFYVSFFIKKEALGEADIIIAACIGALVGAKLGLLSIFLSAVLSLFAFLIAMNKNIKLPYIPFLGISLWIVYIFNDFFSNLLNRAWNV